MIKDFVPLADLNDLVFGGWDIFTDSAYDAAANAKVLEKDLLLQIKPFMESIKPMPAVFDHNYVKLIDGPNVKKGKNKLDLAEQLRADIRNFKKENNCDRLVMIWCASTESFQKASEVHASVAPLRRGWRRTIRTSRPRRFMPMRRCRRAFLTRTEPRISRSICR